MSKVSVVVVGGGFAGTAVAKQLSSALDPAQHQVTLISSRPFAIYYPATLRMVVTDKGHLEDSAIAPYDNILGKAGAFKQGTVVGIEDSQGAGGNVVLQSGERVPYTYLVLAPGSQWDGPLNFPTEMGKVREHVQLWRQKFSKANEIVVIGGGAVGIELSGELKDLSPAKSVTIVHGAPMLTNEGYPNNFRQGIAQQLDTRSIKLSLGEYIDELPQAGASTVATRSGKNLPADLVVSTRGGRPNTEFIKTLDSGVVTPEGHILVEDTLQVKGHSHIFAAGDVIKWKEQKQAAKAGNHAGVVVSSLLFLITGKGKMAKYTGSPEMIVITNGKTRALGYLGVLWGIVIPSFFAAWIKARNLMVWKFRSDMKV